MHMRMHVHCCHQHRAPHMPAQKALGFLLCPQRVQLLHGFPPVPTTRPTAHHRTRCSVHANKQVHLLTVAPFLLRFKDYCLTVAQNL